MAFKRVARRIYDNPATPARLPLVGQTIFRRDGNWDWVLSQFPAFQRPDFIRRQDQDFRQWSPQLRDQVLTSTALTTFYNDVVEYATEAAASWGQKRVWNKLKAQLHQPPIPQPPQPPPTQLQVEPQAGPSGTAGGRSPHERGGGPGMYM